MSYWNEAEFEFDDKDFATTQQLVFSAYHELKDKLAVMRNLNWQDWSAYQTLMHEETQDT